MTKPRKKYKPKYIARNVIHTFFGGMSGTHLDHLRTLQIKNHAALASITQGHGDRSQWDQLCGALNMACVMSEQGIGPEFRETFMVARAALLEAGKRYLRTDRVVLTGDELHAINEGMECHDTQLENVRAIDLDRAAQEVQRRLAGGINTVSVRKALEEDREAA